MGRHLFVVVWISVLAASCARAPQDAARRYIASGDRYAHAGRADAALIEYRNAVRAWPLSSEAHQRLGDALEQLGRTDEGYRAYADAIDLADGQPLPSQRSALEASVARAPRSVAARIALARVLLAEDRPGEAEKQLTAAAALDPADELVNRSLAAILLRTGRTADAEQRLIAAAAHVPQRYRSGLALVDFLMSQDRYVEARSQLDRMRGSRPLQNEVRLRLAAVDYHDGDAAAAEIILSDLITTDPTPAAYTLRAECRLREDRLAEAAAAAGAALALDPRFAAAAETLDQVRQRQLIPSASARFRSGKADATR